jgi:molecular chaperone DnaK
VDGLKTALAGDDDEAVKTAYEKLSSSQQKLGEAIYSSAQPTETPAGEAGDGQQAGESSSDDEDVIDAEVVEDEEKK